MMRIGRHAFALLALAACGRRFQPADPPVAPVQLRRPVEPARPLPTPASVGTIMILDVALPPAGTPIGGHFQGAGFSARAATLLMADGLRARWARAVRGAGDSLLTAAGYVVRPMGPPSSDASPLVDVRFGLTADVTELSVRTTGRVAPLQIDAHAEAVWELVDLAAGGAVLTVRTQGNVRLTDSVDLAAVQAVSRTLEQLMADSSFRTALGAPRPRTLADIVFAPAWSRPQPGPFDTLRLGSVDLNVSADPDPVQRVAHGVFAVHGTEAASFTAFTITRDGLALASGVPARERRLWGRFHDGRDRSVRVLRALDDVALLQIMCDEPCATVAWNAVSAEPGSEPVFILGGPRYTGDALYLAFGRLLTSVDPGGASAVELRIDGDVEGGEPVARRADGVVVAIASHGRAVRLTDALRQLGVSVSASVAPHD
jgi:hypothetical protein